MKKKLFTSIIALMINFNMTVLAQPVMWSQTYETFTMPTTQPSIFAGKADYDVNGNLFVAGRSNPSSLFITIDKINSGTGAVVSSATYPTAMSFNFVRSLKVFRNELGMNYVYVLFQAGTTTPYLRLLKYDSNLNLIDTLALSSPGGVGAYALEVDPVNGNAVIFYNESSIYKISRCKLDLTLDWTRALPPGDVKFKFCPTNSWIALISANGLQRISALNSTEWTVSSITSATALDINGSGEIYLSTGITIKKYSSTGVLGFISVFFGTASSLAFIKTSAYGGAYIAFNESTSTRLKYFNSTGGNPWGTVVSSPSITLNGLEEINGNPFISAYKVTIITPGSDVRDSSFIIKYNNAGALIYRDGFSVPIPPAPSITGINSMGITRYKSQLTVYGSQSDYTPLPNYTCSWYLRTYGPTARFESPETTKTNLNFSVYPNPALNNLHIISKSEINKVSIHDLTGRQIKELENISFESELDVSYLKPGAYMLMVSTKEKQSALKFIKQ